MNRYQKKVINIFATLTFIVSSLTSAVLAEDATTSGAKENHDEITFYFVRHGKTLLNEMDRVQGWIDSPLTEQGKTVVQNLGKGLEGINFDAFYSSDAGRHRETLQLILDELGNPDAPRTEIIGLREMNFGGHEGSFNKEMGGKAAEIAGMTTEDYFKMMREGKLPIKQSITDLAKSDPKGLAENYEQVTSRIKQALDTMTQNSLKNHQKTILVISSGTSIQALLDTLTDNPKRHFPLKNAAVIVIKYKDGVYTVKDIGDMSYIEKGTEKAQAEAAKTKQS